MWCHIEILRWWSCHTNVTLKKNWVSRYRLLNTSCNVLLLQCHLTAASTDTWLNIHFSAKGWLHINVPVKEWDMTSNQTINKTARHTVMRLFLHNHVPKIWEEKFQYILSGIIIWRYTLYSDHLQKHAVHNNLCFSCICARWRISFSWCSTFFSSENKPCFSCFNASNLASSCTSYW